MASPQLGQRFGEQFVQTMGDKYARRRRTERPLSYDIAVDEQYEPWRAWLDEQLAYLPDATADELANRLWPDEHFWPTVFELAVGVGLRAAGLDVAYEPPWGSRQQTPDWTVLDVAGKPLCFVEVHTDEPPKGTYGTMRQWHDLAQRIAHIPVPVVLVLDSAHDRYQPPSPRESKAIAQSLRDQLLGPRRAARFEAGGYYFVVLANRFGPLRSPNGLRAAFEPPSPTTGPVSAANLVKRIEDKVAKYKLLADEYNVPLIVAVGAHKFTGVGLDNLDNLLQGSPTVTFQFGIGDGFIGEKTLAMDNAPTWSMPRHLSGILWVSNEFPFPLASRPNFDTYRVMPEVLVNLG